MDELNLQKTEKAQKRRKNSYYRPRNTKLLKTI